MRRESSASPRYAPLSCARPLLSCLDPFALEIVAVDLEQIRDHAHDGITPAVPAQFEIGCPEGACAAQVSQADAGVLRRPWTQSWLAT